MQNIILFGLPFIIIAIGYFLWKGYESEKSMKESKEKNTSLNEESQSVPEEQIEKKIAIVTDSEHVEIDQRTFHYPEEIIRGLKEWGLLDDSFGDKYFTNDLISSFIESIRQSIFNDRTSFIQILGLAGLGKTRLVYECFHQFTAYSSEVFYCNAASQEGEIQRYSLKLVKEKKEGVLIVDNCNSSLNEILYSELPKNEGSLNIITIDKEVNERHGSHKKIEQFILKPQHFENDVIPEMVKFYYPQLPSADVEKIAAFSQGFPMIAKLLANGLNLGVENIGELTDDALLRKLIGVNETEDEDAYHVLKACSIFDKLGYTHELKTHKEFVANNSAISRLTSADNVALFENKCSRFLKRGILEKQGRYISVRPKPLAIRLAADWWRECIERGNGFEIIQQVTAQGMGEDLCNQIAKLDFLEEAQQLTEELCGHQAPFGKAEVLNTAEGSRLFRSLAEVNPQVATETLFHHYGDADVETLINIEEGRRYLVWTLEKLCFGQDTFEKASKVLLNFAVAENENISNNATGQFNSLFQLLLPGTSANLDQRFQIIEYAFSKDNLAYSKIALSAISRSFSSIRGSSRMMGAEDFGSSPKLEDYRPSKQEVEDYYKKLLQILKDEICNEKEFWKEAKTILGESINGIVDNGFGNLAFQTVHEILDYKGEFWKEAFLSTIHLYHYSEGKYSDDIRAEILTLTERLKPLDFNSQYRMIVKSPTRWDIYSEKSYKQLRGEGLNYSDITKANIENLLKNNIEEIDNWDLNLLFQEQQQQSIFFGSELGRVLIDKGDESYSSFLDRLVEISLSGSEEIKDVSVLAGYLGNTKDKAIQNKVLTKLLTNNFPLHHFLNIARFCKPTFEDIISWIDIYSEKNESLSAFHMLAYGKVLNYMSLSEIIKICERIASKGKDNIYLALDVLTSYVKLGEGSWEKSKETIKRLITTKGFVSNIDRLGVMIILDIRKYISAFLKEEDENFIRYLKDEVIVHISDAKRLSYHSEIENLLRILITDHFSLVWKDLGQLMLENPYFYITAKFHLGVREGSMYTEGMLFSNKENLPKLLEWCKNHSPKAPRLISGIMPTSSRTEGGRIEWHPFALDMINEFGDDDKLLNEIHANFGSYGSVGSSVPYLKSKLHLLQQIKDHPIKRVRTWANNYISEMKKQIEHEELIDDEWGIR